MNTKLMFSSVTDQWATPEDFFKSLDKEFHFDLDPCADAHNHKCEKYFTAAENGLLQNWGGTKFFVIRHMVKSLKAGLRRHMKRATKIILLFAC